MVSNINALKKLITHDIMDSLKRNVDAGNITHNEAVKLSGMILRLYHHIYDGYEKLENKAHNLETDVLRLVNLLAQTYSPEEIAAQTGIPEEKIKDILHTES